MKVLQRRRQIIGGSLGARRAGGEPIRRRGRAGCGGAQSSGDVRYRGCGFGGETERVGDGLPASAGEPCGLRLKVLQRRRQIIGGSLGARRAGGEPIRRRGRVAERLGGARGHRGRRLRGLRDHRVDLLACEVERGHEVGFELFDCLLRRVAELLGRQLHDLGELVRDLLGGIGGELAGARHLVGDRLIEARESRLQLLVERLAKGGELARGVQHLASQPPEVVLHLAQRRVRLAAQ